MGNGQSYHGGSTSKGIHILGDPRAQLLPDASLTLTGLAPGQHFSIKRIDRQQPFLPTYVGAFLRVVQCQGSVHVEDVQVTLRSYFANIGPVEGALTVQSSRQVTVAGSGLEGGIGIDCVNSTLAVVGSGVGGRAYDRDPAPPGLRADQSNVVLCETWVAGGPGNGVLGANVPGGPGLLLTGGRVSVRAETASSIIAGWYCASFSCSPDQSAIINNGAALEVDNLVELRPWGGAPPVVGPIVRTDNMPALVAMGAPIGGSVSLRLRAQPNALAAVLISLTADPLPTPFGDLWLNVLANKAVFGAVTDATGRLQTQWAVTAGVYPRPSGVLAAQAVVLPMGPLELSNPATVVLR